MRIFFAKQNLKKIFFAKKSNLLGIFCSYNYADPLIRMENFRLDLRQFGHLRDTGWYLPIYNILYILCTCPYGTHDRSLTLHDLSSKSPVPYFTSLPQSLKAGRYKLRVSHGHLYPLSARSYIFSRLQSTSHP